MDTLVFTPGTQSLGDASAHVTVAARAHAGRDGGRGGEALRGVQERGAATGCAELALVHDVQGSSARSQSTRTSCATTSGCRLAMGRGGVGWAVITV